MSNNRRTFSSYVSYDKISQSLASVSPTSDTGKTCLLTIHLAVIFNNDLQDVKDTFLHPAIDLLVAEQQQLNKHEHIILVLLQVLQDQL
ncbi:MAG: hypothetical protein CM15mV8_0310 [Caudoviricetes sp.]|nr:MAG: hypothetical protein CM15mV8_0310 [Caudoviricetes sp.]